MFPVYFLSVVLINFFIRMGKKFILKGFQKNLNMLLRKKKISEYITADIEISSDSDRQGSDEDISNEEN